MATQRLQDEKSVARRSYSYLTVPLVIIFCFALAFVLFLVVRNSPDAAAQINRSVFNGREHGPAMAEVKIAKPTEPASALEVVVLPTLTPLPSAAPELALPPSATAQLLPTSTPLPTNTLIPTASLPAWTATSSPTALPLPTDTPVPTASPTATVQVAYVEAPSPTPLPTDTAEPIPTRYVAATPNPSGGVASGEHWIDVDLTRQMVFAFEGNTVVNSFIVSTGTWQYPTVTGQYRVYVKYRSTTMSGPGYSLPNVPYTMYFYKGYGIHGTYWHNNFGTPMSHGCVNLTIPDAEWLYNWSSVGTLVNIHY
jgi:lipoprotein-anchoring transpeptidase ErfK/SrfK